MPALPLPLSLLLLVALLFGLTLLVLELRHRLRPASPLILRSGPWTVRSFDHGLKAIGEIEIANPHGRMEVMVPELRVVPTLLGTARLDQLMVSTRIEALHPDEEARADGYWAAYIVKGHKRTRARLTVRIEAPLASN